MSNKLFFQPAAPESLGIPSGAISAFIDELAGHKLNIHGFVILKDGKVAAEAYYKPFKVNELHRMYSSTKSFVSVAIGLLCDEGKISLDDHAIDFFPDKLPQEIHPYTAAMKIRHLLMMSSAHKNTTYGRTSDPNENWVGSFFTTTPSHWPGQVFSYDTSATTVLTAIVERVSGKGFVEFLQDKILRKMGFSEDAFCVRTADGEFEWGGSGLCCSLRDFAKFGYLIMNKGEWEGQQLVSREYMTQATSRLIDNSTARRQEGYGFKFWRWPENGFGTSGMGTQNLFCYPDQDLLCAVIADTQPHPYGAQLVLDSFLRNVKHSVCENLPEDKAANDNLLKKIDGLAVPLADGALTSPVAAAVSGKKYALEDTGASGEMSFKSVKFDFGTDSGSMFIESADGVKEIQFGLGKFVEQDFPDYCTAEEFAGEPVCAYGFGPVCKLHLPCINSAAWVMDSTLVIICYAVGTFVGTLKIEAAFDVEKGTVTLATLKFSEKFWENYGGFQSGVL